MSISAFPATTEEQFPSSLHSFLHAADRGDFVFPKADECAAPPLENMSARQERQIKFGYFNFWFAALRVYYINAAFQRAVEVHPEPGDVYVTALRVIERNYQAAERALYEHYGYDYEGPVKRRVV